MSLSNSPYAPLASLPLMVWLSPAFPVGGFAYSHALEWAARTGDLADWDTLRAWLHDLIAHGAMRTDAILLAAAWRGARGDDCDGLGEVNDLALALAGSRERHLETSAQGDAFRTAIRASWRNDMFDSLDRALPGPIALPVVVAVAAAAHDQDIGATLDAFLTSQLSNLTQVAIRLGVIGQPQAQRLIAGALPQLGQLAAFAAHATTDDIGGCAFRSDIAAMRHETLEGRLFRT